MIETRNKTVGTYEHLAPEYYDSVRHPTCANFREGSKLILNELLRKLPIKDSWFCEIGAGKSLVAELLSEKNITLGHLIITDLSASMLKYSKQWYNIGAHLLIADAINLPFASGSLEIVVSSLGDPYNTYRLWKESFRVLKPYGIFIFTTPSYEWAISFRGKNSGEAFMLSEFELLDGRRIRVPSRIYPIEEQLTTIKDEGFLVQDIVNVSISDLKSRHISPKLLSERGLDLKVVTGYILTKK